MTLNVVKFAQCLRELGIEKLDFHNRKKLKNLAYLLTVFGVNIGLPLKSFRWYLHGIYNKEITALIVSIGEKHA